MILFLNFIYMYMQMYALWLIYALHALENCCENLFMNLKKSNSTDKTCKTYKEHFLIVDLKLVFFIILFDIL